MAGSYNPNRVKRNRSYRVDEIARLLDCHKNTVLRWLKEGLSTIDDTKPYMVHGSELKRFLSERRKQRKFRCKLYEFYCLRCRVPREPLKNTVQYIPQNHLTGRLRAVCGSCGGMLNRYTKLSQIYEFRAYCPVEIQSDLEHITDMGDSLLNSDLEEG